MSDKVSPIYEILCKKVEDKGFRCEKLGNRALFIDNDFIYKVEVFTKENKVFLDRQENDNITDEWKSISSWLFEDEMDSKSLRLIAEDFADSMLQSDKEKQKKIKGRNFLSNESSDALFFANRIVNIFPELRKEIFIEKECYSEFRGVEFTKNNILPRILKLISENIDTKKIEKLFKLLSDLYKNSSLNIKSLITMVIMNNITDEKSVEVVKKHIDDNLYKAWLAAMKFKNKKLKPEKSKTSKNFLMNSLSK